MLFLGFSAGLPFLLVFSTLTLWLNGVGVDKITIGFFSWIGITYSIKFFWAPIIDRVPMLFLTRWLGKRRSWMLVGQIGIACGLIGMASTNPQTDLAMMAWFGLLVAFSSATQDVALDAYRIEAMDSEYQGAMAANYVLGYRLGTLVAGAGALYIADAADWPMSYLIMAVLTSVGMLTVLIIREPEHVTSEATLQQEQHTVEVIERTGHLPSSLHQIQAWFINSVISPFADFVSRFGVLAIVILIFVGVYRMSDITLAVMANPFYQDLGFTNTDIANISKVFGFAMTLMGIYLGGILIVRYGIKKPLILGAVLVTVTNLLFAYMATLGADKIWLSIVIGSDSFSGGLATSAFIAYLSSLTSPNYTATQYALFSSFMTLPAKVLGGFSGVIVLNFGYQYFFTYAAMLGLPAILLALYLATNTFACEREARAKAMTEE